MSLSIFYFITLSMLYWQEGRYSKYGKRSLAVTLCLGRDGAWLLLWFAGMPQSDAEGRGRLRCLCFPMSLMITDAASRELSRNVCVDLVSLHSYCAQLHVHNL